MGKPLQLNAWNTEIQAIEDAFRQLPPHPHPSDAGLSREQLISGIGRQLVLVARSGGLSKPAATKASLAKLQKKAISLARDLKALSPQTVRAMKVTFSDIAVHQLMLEALVRAADRAKLASKKGGSKKLQARQIAEIAAVHYAPLTGKKPTVPKNASGPYGPFLNLVRSIFSILGIRASAASQADSVSRDWAKAAHKILAVGYR